MKELAIGYCRVSTKKQEKQGLSLDAQEDYVRNNADGKFDVVKFFKVQESGGDSERKHLMEAFSYCIENSIKHILITDSDRWTRSREMDIEAQKFIKKRDLKVHILRERRVIGQFGSAQEKFIHNVLVDHGEMVRDTITQGILGGIKKKLEKGEYPGTLPHGYKSIKKTDKSPHRIVSDEKAPMVKELLKHFNSGKFSVRQMIRFAKDIGLKPKKKSEFTKGAMAKLIKNRFYYGEFEYSHPWIDGGKPKIYENKTEGFKPIITKKMWEENQAILRRHQTNHKGRNKHKHLFNNLITCGKCGGLVFGFKPDYKVKWKTKNGVQTKTYSYDTHYICNKNYHYTTNGVNSVPKEYVDPETLTIMEDIVRDDEPSIWLKKGQKVKKQKCDMPYFLESEIEKMLVGEIGLIKFNKRHYQKIKDGLFKDETKEFLDYEIRNLRTELTKSEIKLDQMYEDYGKGIIDAEYLKSRREGIRNRQREAKDRLEELEEERELYDEKIGKSIEILDALKNWEKIFKEADAEKKNQLIRLLTIKISTHFFQYRNPKIESKPQSAKLLNIEYLPEVEELFKLGVFEKTRREPPLMPVFNSPKFRYSHSDH